MPLETAVIASPVGNIRIDSDGSAIVALHLSSHTPLQPPSSPLLTRAAQELDEYFSGARRSFSVPLRPPGGASEFQRRVWEALTRIPYGQTQTYGQVASALGTSPRAVGGACARNALPLFIPCHRVVARDGIGGFSGEWATGISIDMKQALLHLESDHSPG